MKEVRCLIKYLSFWTAFSLSDAASISEGELSGLLIIEHVPGIETEGEKKSLFFPLSCKLSPFKLQMSFIGLYIATMATLS